MPTATDADEQLDEQTVEPKNILQMIVIKPSETYTLTLNGHTLSDFRRGAEFHGMTEFSRNDEVIVVDGFEKFPDMLALLRKADGQSVRIVKISKSLARQFGLTGFLGDEGD
jgi:hypothetical protein